MKRVERRDFRDNLVTHIPLIRVLNGVGVDVPLAVVGVPVRIHGPDFVKNTVRATAS